MKTSLLRIAILVFTLVSLAVLAWKPTTRTMAGPKFTKPASAAEATQARLADSYGKLPLSFEANRGQTDPRVKFISRGNGYTLFLTSDEAVLALRSQKPDAALSEAKGVRSQKDKSRQSSAVSRQLEKTTDHGLRTTDTLRMKLVGANQAAKVTALDELPGKSNYFIGNDPKKWRTDVPTYGKVKYEGVYPGIDLVYYGNQRQLEYDFVVAPGADPNRIVLGFQGAERLEINAEGELVLHAAGGAIRQRVPVIYQEINGVRTKIEGRYVLKDAHRVGFQVAAYDQSRPLVIDPTLVYSTYLGGSGGDVGHGIAVDAAGAAYVTGLTGSADFTAGCTAPCTVLDGTLSGVLAALDRKIGVTGTGASAAGCPGVAV